MAKVSEFGRKWDRRTPRAHIHWLMGRVHVGTPDEQITADITRRCTAPELVAEAVEYALVCHRQNQVFYNHVMR